MEKARDTDRQMIEKMMSREAWKIFAIPSAMQTNVNKVVKRVARARMREQIAMGLDSGTTGTGSGY